MSVGRFVMELSGYALSPLQEGRFTVYRGSGEGLAPILLVAAAGAYPAPDAIQRLEHELALRADLDGDWAAQPVELLRRDGRLMLVLADPGGEPLDGLVGQPMGVTAFLRIAVPLAAAVGRLHARGLIHKDLKPANILVDTASNGVWLTGFGIASRLPREHQGPSPPEAIAGTLAYMAPEQTGRMNRSVDSRSDLYALGVTLYEMLTGLPPFDAADPMEWVHCHLARRPPPPTERVAGIPGPLSAIVMKLLAKTAEDRYQTAAGLTVDLRRCLADWEATGGIEAFPLGQRDASDHLLLPERLYGREGDIDRLLAAFDRVVAHGAPELVLVSGHPGIGKSSVAQELHKALVPTRGLFASGKFDQYKRDIPYGTLAQAFGSLLRQVLGQSDEALGGWRRALNEALGPNGQLMVNLVPELELVIGKQPPVADLPAIDAEHRFQMVFRRFLGVFARDEHPLALFLDDLQWLDMATLALLEHLMTHAEVRHLMLVGAYRDNEVGVAHPLTHTIEAIGGAGVGVEEIVLASLGIEDVSRLVAEGLHCDAERARSLAQLVHDKTGGNPFFVIQFITALVEEGLLLFDPGAPGWRWEIDRIRARRYTDNVVELLVGKLTRLPDETRQALKQLACLGPVADIATLALVQGEPEPVIDEALWEAVRAGLIVQVDSAYRFLHDRIQQAAYSLIAETDRAEVHLRIGRLLLAGVKAEELEDQIFDVASQLNRGAALLVDPDEKARAASVNLRAGEKAKAAAAHASARAYFSAGMALLDEGAWDDQHELAFSLWLGRAECEYLSGSAEAAEALISALLARARSKIDKAAAYRLKISLHVMRAEFDEGVEAALACLRLFGIEMPAHPTREQVEAEYQKVWANLGDRPIESLIDLPLMTDPEMRAAMGVLSVLSSPAQFTDLELFRLHLCHMVNLTLKYGATDASGQAFSRFGTTLGSISSRPADGYGFGKLACDLVEKHGFATYRARTYFAMEMIALWTQPIGIALDYVRAAFRAGVETGELSIACYTCNHAVADLLTRGDNLDAVWRETERGLEFVRKAKIGHVVDGIENQQRFIQTMSGRTGSLSPLSDVTFDETIFAAQPTEGRSATMICWYWIFKLQARFILGDHAAAIAAALKAKALLWASDGHIQLLDYYYYAALAVAAVCEDASADEQAGWRDLLTTHQEQLGAWARAYPPTFGDKYALVSAEIARLEGRDLEAMRLYEEAIRAARDNGFVQNEALAHEVAARFYAGRGFETIASAYLRNARYGYLRWGALAKVRRLEQQNPKLLDDAPPPPAAEVATSVGQLDIGAVLKASQAVSGEIVLDRLIETLMTIALEAAGAQRGLLILLRGDALQVEAEAEAKTDHGKIEVTLRQAPVTPDALPEGVLQTVLRTRQSVMLDDASAPQSPFVTDAYVRRTAARSVLCLPLVKQAKLIGALYLENNLASHVFTPARISVLELLASQAAIALENARLYGDLQLSEERWRNLFENVPVGVTLAGPDGRYVSVNQAFQRMTGYSEGELLNLSPMDIIHEDDRAPTKAGVTARAAGAPYPKRVENRYRRKDGGVIRAEGRAFIAPAAAGAPLFATVEVDVTNRIRAEEALQSARAELVRVARLTTMGELLASITHEINQPLAAIATNGSACLRWLNWDEPDLASAREAVADVVKDALRAGDVIHSLRALTKKSEPILTKLDLRAAIEEVVALTRGELRQHGVVLRTELSAGDQPVLGDRVQLQQVMLNLIMNGMQAMTTVTDRDRELSVSVALAEPGRVQVAVEDTGPGLDPAVAQRIFEPFFTTKPDGLGIGLSICRSIVEAHGGCLRAFARAPHGAAFRFTIPVAGGV
jgi:PAS domain S-box-containing protein